MFHYLTVVILTVLLTSCPKDPDAIPPSTAITTPAQDAVLAGTVPVQIDALDNTSVSRVDVYARSRGSKVKGVLVGSAVSKPFVISWNTSAVPNNTALELVAFAKDAAGNEGASTPVRVKTQNQNLPILNYLLAYTLPIKPATFALQRAKDGGLLPDHTRFSSIAAPSDQSSVSNLAPRFQTRQSLSRSLALEWSWQAFNSVGSISGADGYGIFVSSNDLAGGYDRVVNQASSTAGTQKYSREFPDAQVGQSYYGLVTAIQNNATTETGLSNADAATFAPIQDASSPSDGYVSSDGRPVLTWTATAGVKGYLYLLYDKNPWDSTAKIIWSNPKINGITQSTAQTSVAFPASSAALPSGTYYWWVAGVKFDALDRTDAMTFSDPRQIVVP